MRDEDPLPVSTSSSSSSSSTSSVLKKETLDRRGRYKFWILSAILLLSFWSILTLHLSLANLNPLTEDFTARSPLFDHFDVLEIEEREKVVKHMWDVYTNNRRIKLPRFWQEAFVAAYEDLTSDEQEVREAAVSEIAKMSFHSAVDLHPPHLHPTNLRELSLRHTQQIEDGLPLQ
ncbi:uncharacterized protein LOC143630280 [Bidens hawaiensis]|uniref:uncharacterized protein LOC143630280 n=1 Tax=Bidens hawaiensis TaxID=980011 RepID=UPI004048F7C1